ncbi:MAG: radical SAM protein, partial [Anaerovoracaceae bacterium]
MNYSIEEITEYLKINSEKEREALFEKARSIREENFGSKIFSYGFVYFSTHCRNDCTFCYYRKSNNIERYRKMPSDIAEDALKLAETGVNLIDLTLGEDSYYVDKNFDIFIGVIERIIRETKLPVMVSPGLVSDEKLLQFKEAGVDFYAVYQETYNK